MDELNSKVEAAIKHFHELQGTIRAADSRMAEISELRTQIIHYAKTREVYAAYRKAGYSKKFRAEHEADILLHQAAKEFFDKQGIKKLPKVKDLNAEYAELLAQKKGGLPGIPQGPRRDAAASAGAAEFETFSGRRKAKRKSAAEPVKRSTLKVDFASAFGVLFCLYGDGSVPQERAACIRRMQF